MNGQSVWIEDLNQPFALSYNGATNVATLQATVSVFTFSTTWLVAGGTPGGGPTNWSIASGALRVVADNNTTVNTSVRIRNLSLSGTGFATLNPPNLTANQTGSGTVTASNSAPIAFTTAAGGSWLLSGQIRFRGLSAFVTGGADGSELRMALDMTASTDVPEPATLLLGALGLAGLGVLHHFRSRRMRLARRAGPNAPPAKPGTLQSAIPAPGQEGQARES